ncbi:hypothetical protein VKS41_008752 [Umbelopsis sp. WA50703]|jgi:diphthamide biosynthesis protein 7
MPQAQSLFSVDTQYSADSTEFCPFQDNNTYLACGTYQLYNDDNGDEPTDPDTPMQRKGRLYLYKKEESEKGIKL